MSVNREIEVHAGDDLKIAVTVTNAAGTAIDITAATIFFGISLVAQGISLITKDLTDGIAITDGPNGVLRITIDAADTSGLVPRKYFYEVKVVLSGERDTVLAGNFILKDSILK